MLQEFLENTLSLNKQEKKYLEYLMFMKIWNDKEFYNFISKHLKFCTYSKRNEISKKIKEIGEILDEKS